MFYKQKLFLKALHCFPPEIAHIVVLKAIRSNFISVNTDNLHISNLRTKLGNLNFNHPLGIAAGFDKNVETINVINKLGISHMEFGTITPNPQPGNSKPRIFRLSEDKAIINKLGFPSKGINSAVKNWLRYKNGRYFFAKDLYFQFDIALNGIPNLFKMRKKTAYPHDSGKRS